MSLDTLFSTQTLDYQNPRVFRYKWTISVHLFKSASAGSHYALGMMNIESGLALGMMNIYLAVTYFKS